jgi:hypothetical protein
VPVSGVRPRSVNARHECFRANASVPTDTAPAPELDEDQRSRQTTRVALAFRGRERVRHQIRARTCQPDHHGRGMQTLFDRSVAAQARQHDLDLLLGG